MNTTESFTQRVRVDLVIVGLIVTMIIVETVLTAGDFGAFGQRGLRSLAYQNGGFWPGLLGDWDANYVLQPYAMFATYAFLHGGLVHLIVNMFTLWSLGQAVIDRVGRKGFGILYLAAVIGGAAGYALFASNPSPMVGASGALFGLAGAWLAWEYVDRFTARVGLWPVVRVVLMLIALNVVMYWSMNGQLAWETHLGGFVSGWIVAMLIDPRSRETEPEDDDAGTA